MFSFLNQFVLKFLYLPLKDTSSFQDFLAEYSLHLGLAPIVPVQAGEGSIRPFFAKGLILYQAL